MPSRPQVGIGLKEGAPAVGPNQPLREAFAFTTPPEYLLHDRDGIYGLEFQNPRSGFGTGGTPNGTSVAMGHGNRLT